MKIQFVIVVLIFALANYVYPQPDQTPRENQYFYLVFNESMDSSGFSNVNNFVVYREGIDTVQILGGGVRLGEPQIGFTEFILITEPVLFDQEYRIEVFNVMDMSGNVIEDANFTYTQIRYRNPDIGKPNVSFGEPNFSGFSVLINVGGNEFFDSSGRLWIKDTGFIGGNVANRGNISIANTVDEQIYQNERYAMSFYRIPVTNANHTVILHFAETYSGISQPGQRIFDVVVEGQKISGLDIYELAGARNSAVRLTLDKITVNDGELTIEFISIVQHPIINGIEVLELSN